MYFLGRQLFIDTLACSPLWKVFSRLSYPSSWVYSSLPENKQMVALSATYPEVLAQHLTAYMRNPTFVRLNALDPALLGEEQI